MIYEFISCWILQVLVYFVNGGFVDIVINLDLYRSNYCQALLWHVFYVLLFNLIIIYLLFNLNNSCYYLIIP